MFAIVFLAWQKEVKTIILDHKIVLLSQKKICKTYVKKASKHCE
jgi:hypothetical protein